MKNVHKKPHPLDTIVRLFNEIVDKYREYELEYNLEHGCSDLDTETEREIQAYKDTFQYAVHELNKERPYETSIAA